MCRRVSYKKTCEKIDFFAPLKSLKKGVGSISQCTDPRIRIRTKMSQILNTGSLKIPIRIRLMIIKCLRM
jgi:hypothetical protein